MTLQNNKSLQRFQCVIILFHELNIIFFFLSFCYSVQIMEKIILSLISIQFELD